MRHFRRFLGSLFVLLFFAGTALGAAGRKIPAPVQIASTLPSVDDAIAMMAVSHPFENTNPKVKTGADLLEFELQGIRDLIESKGDFAGLEKLPADKREILVVRYELGVPEGTDLLIKAMKMGFGRVVVVTDLNESINGVFDGKNPFNSNFQVQGVSYKSNPMGQELKRLIEAGFKFNDQRFGIFSQPLFDQHFKDDQISIKPIMHEKEVKLIAKLPDGTERRVAFDGTANWPRRPRFNRTTKVAEPAEIEYGIKHADRMIEAFSQGLQIKDIKSEAPLRITYKDGTWLETGFTDGKYNLNNRIVDYVIKPIMDKAAKDPANNGIVEIIDSHFVFTASQVYQATIDAMKADPRVKMTGVYDAKALSPFGYGFVPALAGYLVVRPGFIPEIFPAPYAVRQRIEAWGYQNGIPGTPDTSPNGAPTERDVWHDKTSIYIVREDGVLWTYVVTGSFNKSNHVDNAESQKIYKFKGDSAMGLSYINSVKKIIEAEKNKALVPLELGVFRDFLREFTGHNVEEIKIEMAKSLVGDLARKDLDAIKKKLLDIVDAPSSISKRPAHPDLVKRVETLMAALKWVSEHRSGKDLRLFDDTMTALGMPLSNSVSSKESYLLFEHALRGPAVAPEQLKKDISAMFQLYGIKEVEAKEAEESNVKEVRTNLKGLLSGRCSILLGS